VAAAAVRGDEADALVESRGSSTHRAPRLERLDGLRLLVVDDDAGGRMLTALILTEAGASVTAVASAREALRVIDVEPPHALVSELDLSDEDGRALIRQIRQRDAARGGCLPAVALTGYARAGDRARSLAAGFHAHVAKPAEPVTLTAAIAAITAASEAGRTL
jgi:CheY-like chemotaxis protein